MLERGDYRIRGLPTPTPGLLDNTWTLRPLDPDKTLYTMEVSGTARFSKANNEDRVVVTEGSPDIWKIAEHGGKFTIEVARLDPIRGWTLSDDGSQVVIKDIQPNPLERQLWDIQMVKPT